MSLWTVGQVLDWTTERFSKTSSPTPRLDAQLLLGHALGLSRVELYTQRERPLSQQERDTMRLHVERRLKGEPIAYILEKKWWHNLELTVSSDVLIPRPETETLLDWVLTFLPHWAPEPKVIFDLCTGSGALAIALALACPGAQVVGLDLCPRALAIAGINVDRYGLKERVFLSLGDATHASVLQSLRDRFGYPDIVVTNPPYVSKNEWEMCPEEVRLFEPPLALLGGDTGLEVAVALLQAMTDANIVSSCRILAMELADNQPFSLARDRAMERLPWAAAARAHVLGPGLYGACDWENRHRYFVQLGPCDN